MNVKTVADLNNDVTYENKSAHARAVGAFVGAIYLYPFEIQRPMKLLFLTKHVGFADRIHVAANKAGSSLFTQSIIRSSSLAN